MRNLLLLGLVGLALGISLGLLVGWVLWPVQYTNTAPAQLRQDYRNDYILMVAAAYQVEENPDAARERLARLDPEQPTRPLVELTETLIAQGGRPTDIQMLVRLAEALGATTPAMWPYLKIDRINRIDRIYVNKNINPVNPVHPVNYGGAP